MRTDRRSALRAVDHVSTERNHGAGAHALDLNPGFTVTESTPWLAGAPGPVLQVYLVFGISTVTEQKQFSALAQSLDLLGVLRTN